MKQLAQSALQSELGEELPPISSKEAAEVIAKAAVQGVQGSVPVSLPEEDPEKYGLKGEDEHWAAAAYMEGMSEEQEALDVVVRKQLKDTFDLLHEGLNEIEDAHLRAQKGVQKQRDGLIKLYEVCEKTPLYNVAQIIEQAFGESVAEGDGDIEKISAEELRDTIKTVFPKPSQEPVRFFDGVTKSGKPRRKYKCPISKCKEVRINREAVAAHIRKVHDHTTIGPCNGCGKFCSPNKESFLIHMAACGGTVPEVLREKIAEKDDSDDSEQEEQEEEVSPKQAKEKKEKKK